MPTEAMHEACDIASVEDTKVDVLDVLVILARSKKLIAIITIAAAIASGVACIALPKYYLGVSRILPPQQSQSSALLMLGQLANLPGLQSLGAKTTSDVYVGMLNSQIVGDAIIARFDLKTVYDEATLIETREALAEDVSISAGKDGIISIGVYDKEPQRAADMANAFVEELTKLTQNLAISEGAQRRLFFERQLQQAKVDLANAEVELKKTQEATGLIQLEEQAGAIIKFVAELKAQIAGREVQLASLRTSATDRNPEYIRLQQELVGLRKELHKMEKQKVVGTGTVLVPTGSVPGAGLEYLRKLRDVKYHEAIFEIMAKQFEAAKVDEAKDTSIIQVLDRATVPDKKAKPKYALVLLFGTLFGFLISLISAFVIHKVKEIRRDANRSNQLRELIDLLHFRDRNTPS